MKASLFAVSGVKNSGKTTLIEALLPRLKAAGLTVVTVKHDGHDFTPDVPQTDSYRHRRAGAAGTAVFSPCRWMIAGGGPLRREILPLLFPQADLFLLEGFKGLDCPKFELLTGLGPVCDPRAVTAYVTDTSFTHPVIPVFSRGDPDGLAALLLELYQKGGLPHA